MWWPRKRTNKQISKDEEWKNRTDWDIAICGKYVRTNSGTSGNGQGGLIKVEGMSYESITTSVSDNFYIDILNKD